MGPILNEVKESALSFYEKITEALAKKNRTVLHFRIKVIAFRDFYCDGDLALSESRFFELPDDNTQFRDFVSSIEAAGGGDEPENALEAIALAMASDWVKEGTKKRHIIMIWTDASAHPLEKALEGKPSNYPQGIPETMTELGDWWANRQSGKMIHSAKRLIIFAPDTQPWTEISIAWENTVFISSSAGQGMDDVDMDVILNTLAGSV
jgi:hypothetical protein